MEGKPGGYAGRIGDQQFDIEMKIWDLEKIPFQHFTIAGQADLPAVMPSTLMNKPAEVRPVLPVQTRNVAAINIGKTDPARQSFVQAPFFFEDFTQASMKATPSTPSSTFGKTTSFGILPPLRRAARMARAASA